VDRSWYDFAVKIYISRGSQTDSVAGDFALLI